MLGKTLHRAIGAIVLSFLGLGALPSALSADPAATGLGRSVFAVLDDNNPQLRSYGWSSLSVLGTVSNPNPLHTATFKRFLDGDGQILGRHVELLFSKLRNKGLTEAEAKAVGVEYDTLRQAALGVPEIAALLVGLPDLAASVSATDFGQIKLESTRTRPDAHPVRLTHATDNVVAELVSALKSQSAGDRLDAATRLSGLQLIASQLDGLEGLTKDPSLELRGRFQLAISLLRNGRVPPALSFVDQELSGPNATGDSTALALSVLTEFAFVDPAGARAAIAARAPVLVPLLGEFEHFVNVSAVLSQLTGDGIAKLNSRAMLKRFEVGTNLPGSSCVYASTLARAPEIPLGLALFSILEKNHSDADKIAACIVFLDPTNPSSQALRDLIVGRQSDSHSDREKRFAYLDTLWRQTTDLDPTSFPNTAGNARKALVTAAASLVDDVSFFSFAGVNSIAAWSTRAEPFGLTAPFVWPYWLRWVVTRVPGFASAIAIWLVALVAVVLMSRSDNVRAFLLFHPLGKQLGVFGQVNALIFAIPNLRRAFFKPYRNAMLGVLAHQESRGYDEKAYFSGSGAAKLQRSGIAAQMRDLDRRTVSEGSTASGSAVTSLKTWKGRVVLVGPSGRGKTMFLRHHILGACSIREPAIFATASSLRGDPRNVIMARFGGAVTDEGFMDSLISSGKLDIYVDGLNEVDPETRAAITDFVASRPAANIFITTQPLERYPGDAAIFLLLPLTRAQILEFLVTREPALPPETKIRGASYIEQARAFVAEKLAEADTQASPDDAAGEEHARALVDRLSNPMDLQTVAELLALGQRPDVWALQKQRHKLVERRYLERTNNEPFPFDAFSRSVYEARRDAKSEVDETRFPRVADILLEEKQIQRYISGDAFFKADGYIFRHDKIRDFYTYRAFVIDPALRALHADDDKFSGVYDLLSSELPTNEAAALREFLSEKALDRGDHRLSDRYLEGLRARRLLESKDPDWLARFDRVDVAPENIAIARDEQLRGQILEELTQAIARLDAGRAGTRVLSAARSDALLEASLALLEEAGFSRLGLSAGQRILVGHPEYGDFALLAIAHPAALPERLIQATKANLESLPSLSGPTLIVANIEADLPPSERSAEAVSIVLGEFAMPGITVMTALDLLTRVRQCGRETNPLANAWRER
jgi:hypothetical protein